MQPGLSRAIPMAILGFMFGALIVIVIRALQQLDPIWAPGPGLVLSGFMMAIFFVIGIGAFDPRLSVHGSEAAEEAMHEALAKAAEKPRSLLTGPIWQLVTLLFILLIIVGGFAALPGGLGFTQTVVPGASTTLVGYQPMDLPFGLGQVQVSTLVIFVAFVIWAFLSLAAAAAILALVLNFLSRNLTELQMAGGAAALPAPASAPQLPAGRDTRATLRTVVIFVVTFVVLYLIFYYVAIGLIFPQPQLPVLSWFFDGPTQLVILSLVNAFVFMLIILRTQLVLHVIGIIARWLAFQLRRIPNILQ